jgi:hypothetical protein
MTIWDINLLAKAGITIIIRFKFLPSFLKPVDKTMIKIQEMVFYINPGTKLME